MPRASKRCVHPSSGATEKSAIHPRRPTPALPRSQRRPPWYAAAGSVTRGMYRDAIARVGYPRPRMAEEGDTIVDPPRGAGEMVGRVLGERYRLDAVLGEGGFSVVYRARHLALGRDVAVKVVQTEHELAD